MEHPLHVQYELTIRLPTNWNLLSASGVRYYRIPLEDTSETFDKRRVDRHRESRVVIKGNSNCSAATRNEKGN